MFAKDLVKLLSGSFQSSSLCFSPLGLQQGGLKAAGTPQQINVWTGEAPGLTGNNEIKKLHQSHRERSKSGRENFTLSANTDRDED